VSEPGTERSERKTRFKGFAPGAAVFCLALIAVLAVYHWILDLGLLGHDTIPLVVSNRVDSLGGFLALFSDKLMGGYFPVDFYRPVLNTVFAVNQAIFDMQPFGYHLSTLIFTAGCLAALFGFCRRLAGPGSLLAAGVACGFFLLHPFQMEILPVPSRQADLLSCLFSLLALYTQLSPRVLALRRPVLLPALFTLLALGSKETALLLPVFIFFLVLLRSPRETRPGRLLQALVATLPHAVALGIAVLARYAILGTLGGHGVAGLENLGTFFDMAKLLLFPQEVMGLSSLAVWITAGLGALLLICGCLGIKQENRSARRRTAVLFLLIWIACHLVLHAYTGKRHPWYFFFPTAGYALLLGLIAQGLWTGLRLQGRKILSAAALVFLALYLGLTLQYSSLCHEYLEWEQGDQTMKNYLSGLEKRINKTPAGKIIKHRDFPYRTTEAYAHYGEGEPIPVLKGATLMQIYTLRAWADYRFPDRKILIKGGWQEQKPVPADTLVILVQPRISLGDRGVPMPQDPNRKGRRPGF